MSSYYRIYTAKAPVNIAVIKYWGKKDETLKIPINDSISGTLAISEMCATTSVAISDKYEDDGLWLNGERIDFSRAKILLDEIKKLSDCTKEILSYKVHIVSINNFPTAAGLASSAAGFACLAYVLGKVYGITDPTQLSKFARQGSGSACRSLFGGFVQWVGGFDHDSSFAKQVTDYKHWPEMRVVIGIVCADQKDVSSSEGMLRSIKTSKLINHRAERVVGQRIDSIKVAIHDKNFEKFAEITMQDSNQFHAICLDTFPPLFYLNETSRQIIKICTIINSHYGKNRVAYTFDAGPNACIYLLNDFVDIFITILREFFRPNDSLERSQKLEVQGKEYGTADEEELRIICDKLKRNGVQYMLSSMRYLINTSIGGGPKIVEQHIMDDNLKP